MNNKKLVIGIITIFFIGVTGLIYSLGANKEQSETVVFLKDADNGERTRTDLEETDEKQSETEQVITDETDSEDKLPKSGNNQERQEKPEIIFVHLCGEVKKPGVYQVVSGSRIIDAVELADGFTKQAAKDAVNLAQIVTDGERIYIPSIQEVKDGNSSFSIPITKKEEQQGTLVNINTAAKDELMTLTGVGEAKAASIIAYREANGLFHKIEDLKKIEGIKDGVFQKIRDLITVD